MSAQATDDIEIRVFEEQEWPRVLEFLLLHYYRDEPLSAGCAPPEPDQGDVDFLHDTVQHGACLVAMQGDRLVAAVIAGPKAADEAEHLEQEAALHVGTKWGHILGILTHMERGANVCARYNVQRALHSHAIGVDTALRGRAIGTRLMGALMQRADYLGYPLIVADCTSTYTAKMLKNLRFELVYTLRYEDYVDEQGVPLFRPPPPHECLQTYALRLDTLS